VIQNSISRVIPETASKLAAAVSHRPTPAPGAKLDRSDYSTGSGDWSDDVANPVDEVQECTFWLSTGLALHGHIRLRRTRPGSAPRRPRPPAGTKWQTLRSDRPHASLTFSFMLWSSFPASSAFSKWKTRRRSSERGEK